MKTHVRRRKRRSSRHVHMILTSTTPAMEGSRGQRNAKRRLLAMRSLLDPNLLLILGRRVSWSGSRMRDTTMSELPICCVVKERPLSERSVAARTGNISMNPTSVRANMPYRRLQHTHSLQHTTRTNFESRNLHKRVDVCWWDGFSLHSSSPSPSLRDENCKKHKRDKSRYLHLTFSKYYSSKTRSTLRAILRVFPMVSRLQMVKKRDLNACF